MPLTAGSALSSCEQRRGPASWLASWRQAEVERADADLGARLLLAADVDRARGVVAHEHGRETGRLVARGDPRRDLLAHLGADLLGDGLPVDERHAAVEVSFCGRWHSRPGPS